MRGSEWVWEAGLGEAAAAAAGEEARLSSSSKVIAIGPPLGWLRSLHVSGQRQPQQRVKGGEEEEEEEGSPGECLPPFPPSPQQPQPPPAPFPWSPLPPPPQDGLFREQQDRGSAQRGEGAARSQQENREAAAEGQAGLSGHAPAAPIGCW